MNDRDSGVSVLESKHYLVGDTELVCRLIAGFAPPGWSLEVDVVNHEVGTSRRLRR